MSQIIKLTNKNLYPAKWPLNGETVMRYMKLAQNVMDLPDMNRPCLSRQIGVVIVDPNTDSVISTGHNGPPDNTPRCDDPEYLRSVVWPQLTQEEKARSLEKCKVPGKSDGDWCDNFVYEHGHCGQCPRKIIGAPSGQRLELCSCAHGETNAIIRAKGSVAGCWMFCSCGVPCIKSQQEIEQCSMLRVITEEEFLAKIKK